MSSQPPQLSRKDLHDVAVYQKVILLCILAYIIGVIVQFAVPTGLKLLIALAVIGLSVVATVFVFLLALKIYPQVTGIILALLTLVPLVGLIVLLIINQKATGVLQERGYRVGLLGANLSQFKE